MLRLRGWQRRLCTGRFCRNRRGLAAPAQLQAHNAIPPQYTRYIGEQLIRKIVTQQIHEQSRTTQLCLFAI